MNYLFKNGVRRIFQTLQLNKVSPQELGRVLRSKGIREVGSFIYHRFPRQQIKQMIKVPCPINSSPEDNIELIKTCKSIRASFNIDEENICSKCPYEYSCKFSGVKGKENQVDAVQDLLNFMQALQNFSEPEKIAFRVWKSGYKSCDNILSMVQDLKDGGEELLSFEKARLQYLQQQEEMKKQGITLEDQDAERTPRKKKKQKQNKVIKRIDYFDQEQISGSPKEQEGKRKIDKSFEQNLKNRSWFINDEVPSKNMRKRNQQDQQNFQRKVEKFSYNFSQQQQRPKKHNDLRKENKRQNRAQKYESDQRKKTQKSYPQKRKQKKQETYQQQRKQKSERKHSSFRQQEKYQQQKFIMRDDRFAERKEKISENPSEQIKRGRRVRK